MNREEAMYFTILTPFSCGSMSAEEVEDDHKEDVDKLVGRFSSTLEALTRQMGGKEGRHMANVLGREPILRKGKDITNGQEMSYII